MPLGLLEVVRVDSLALSILAVVAVDGVDFLWVCIFFGGGHREDALESITNLSSVDLDLDVERIICSE